MFGFIFKIEYKYYYSSGNNVFMLNRVFVRVFYDSYSIKNRLFLL